MVKHIVKKVEKDDFQKENKNDYIEFLKYMGIDPEDFEGLNDSVDFDDYSH